jgi:hypothetical protein
MKKRILGIEDMDTSTGIDKDFEESTYPGSKRQYEDDIINQIDYLIDMIHKKGGLSL